jgi:hypothetical protein
VLRAHAFRAPPAIIRVGNFRLCDRVLMAKTVFGMAPMSREHQSEPRIDAADRIIADARMRIAAQKTRLRRLARTDRDALAGKASVLLMTMRRSLTLLERNRVRLLTAEDDRAAHFVRGPATVISLAEVRAARAVRETEAEVLFFEPRHPPLGNT